MPLRTQPPFKPRLVVFAGQSNMLGHRKATDGPKPASQGVWCWDNGGAAGNWVRAELGRAPFNAAPGAPNNMAYHFAVRLWEEERRPVLLLGTPVNGSTLLSWTTPEAPNMHRLIAEMGFALGGGLAGQTIDAFLWHQGESDDELAAMVKEPKLASRAAYAEGFRTLAATLTALPAWNRQATRFFAGELVDDGWLAARNDFYREPRCWPKALRMAVAPSSGLTDVGDRAHFSGEALAAFGRRMHELWRSV